MCVQRKIMNEDKLTELENELKSTKIRQSVEQEIALCRLEIMNALKKYGLSENFIPIIAKLMLKSMQRGEEQTIDSIVRNLVKK